MFEDGSNLIGSNLLKFWVTWPMSTYLILSKSLLIASHIYSTNSYTCPKGPLILYVSNVEVPTFNELTSFVELADWHKVGEISLIDKELPIWLEKETIETYSSPWVHVVKAINEVQVGLGVVDVALEATTISIKVWANEDCCEEVLHWMYTNGFLRCQELWKELSR